MSGRGVESIGVAWASGSSSWALLSSSSSSSSSSSNAMAPYDEEVERGVGVTVGVVGEPLGRVEREAVAGGCLSGCDGRWEGRSQWSRRRPQG